MQIQRIIEQLGYKPNEAKVYLAALALGECHVTDIAARVRLPRSSVQAIIDKLHEDGLMNFYVQRRYKYWVAENPERLLSNLKKREEMLSSVLPSLSAMRRKNWGKRYKRSIGGNEGIFRILADASLQPVLIANEFAEIVYANAAWEKQFGYLLEEIKGQNPRILQSGKTPHAVFDRMWEALRKGKMFQTDEVVDKKKDGTLFTLLTTVFPVKYQDNLFYIQILDDISERKRAETLRNKFFSVAQGGSTGSLPT